MLAFHIGPNYFYVGGRALPGPRLELNLEPAEHSARHVKEEAFGRCRLVVVPERSALNG